MTQSPKTDIAQAKTAAELALSRQFAEMKKAGAFAEAESGFLPAPAEREQAIAAIEEYGLPTRRAEDWHYTDLRRLLHSVAPIETAGKGESLPPLLPQATVLAVVNGKAAGENASGAGLRAEALSRGSRADMPFAVLPAGEKQGESAKRGGNITADLNTAFARDGWHINAGADEGEERFIELQNIQNGGQSHSRFPVHIGAKARLTVLERQIGDDAESFLTSAAEVQLAEGAEVRWIILRERGAASHEFNRFQARLGKGAKLTLYIVNAGAQFLRQEVNVDLAGEEANFQLRGINLLCGNSHTDTTMIVRHLVENTASTEIFRNVVAEEARGVFQGTIRVAKEAQKTDARMACNSLILSDKAEFDAKPELEIFADDVACGHGATVAEIDHNHLFYLMARGIPEGQARALLVKAFIGELLDELPEAPAGALRGVLEKWLAAHFHG